jgi:lipopolysaccharide transport system permease protein
LEEFLSASPATIPALDTEASGAALRIPGAAITPRFIAPRRGWQPLQLAQLYRYRDLLGLLALRDVQVRYRQTALGALWAVIQPLATMVVLTAVFGRFFGPNGTVCGVPYPIFVYAGLLPWMLFASAVNAGGSSLVNNAGLLTKVYFPRLTLPVASLGAPLVDYGVACVILAGMMCWYHTPLTWQLLLLPLLLATLLATALGVGLLLAAFTITYRDLRHVVPFLLQVWFFLTPVIVPTSSLPHQFSTVYRLNPISGSVAAFRAATLGMPVPWMSWGFSAVISGACLWAGLYVFARTERRFADVA